MARFGRALTGIGLIALVGVGGSAATSHTRAQPHVRVVPLRATKPHARPAVDAHTVFVKLKGKGSFDQLGLTPVGGVPHTGWTLVHVDDGAEHALGRLRRDPRVDAVQPNYIRRAFDANDPLYTKGAQNELQRVGLPQAWAQTHGDASLKIAVVDTGVDANHPDLAGHVAAGYDFVNGDTDPSDDEGHGTMVAGIAAAATGNGVGIAGAAWSATILPVKVLDASGSGTDANIANGITWAADNGARVINLSLGGPGDSQVLHDAVSYARSQGVLVVAAAGNSGAREQLYPAAYDEVLAVGATDWTGNVAYFSTYGSWVDLAAPGMDITSTYPAPGTRADYATGDGTSFASPLVAGVAALVRSQNPTWTPDQVAQRLRSTARDVGAPGIDDMYGSGVLDANAALGGSTQTRAAMPPGDSHEPNNTPAQATVVPFTSTTLYGRISVEGDVDWYAFDVPAGSELGAEINPDDQPTNDAALRLDPQIEIFGPRLEPAGAIDDVFFHDPQQQYAYAPTAGRYYVRVSNIGPSRTSYDYSMTVYAGSTPTPAFSSQGYEIPSWPSCSAIGDVNGDGRPDVLVTTTYYDTIEPYKLVLLAQRPDGTLADPQYLDTDGLFQNTEMGVATGDLNGDGKTDVAVAVGQGVDVFLQQNGALAAPTLVAAPGATHVVLGDVNRDGRLDIAVNSNTDGAYVLLAAAGGGYTRVNVTTTLLHEVELGDVTGDGVPDIVGLDSANELIHVYPQTATGTFGAPVDYRGSLNIFYNGIEVADLNGDGRKDVALAAEDQTQAPRIDLFLQNAGGGLATTPVQVPSAEGQEALASGDINGDGRTDLIVANGGFESVGVLLQNSDGTLGAEQTYRVADASHYPPKALAVGDINGDGKVDITLADYYLGLTALRQRSASWPPPDWIARSASPADLSQGFAASGAPSVDVARQLDPASVTTSTVTLSDGTTGATVSGSVSYSGTTVTFTPSTALAAGHPYHLQIAGTRDTTGATQIGTIDIRFATGGGSADTTPPETYIDFGPTASTVSQSSNVGFSSSEPGSSYECALDSSSYYFCRTPYPGYPLGPGSHTFSVRAIDGAGNVDPTPATRTWTVAATPPAPANDWWSSAQVISGAAGTLTASNAGAGPEGDPPIAGNRGGASIWYRWTPATSGPATFDTAGSGFDTLLAVYDVSVSPSVQVAASDDASATVRTSSVTFDAVAGTPYVIDVDGYHNGWAPETGSVTLSWRGAGAPNDTAPPTVQITSPANNARVPGRVVVTANASDDTSVAKVEFRADGTLFATATQAPYTGTWDATAQAQGSVHQIEARAYDTSGKTAAATISVTVDPTPPDTTITGGPTGSITANSATFSFSANEPSTFSCRLESDYGYGDWAACTSPTTYTGLAGGNYWVNVQARDTVGNVDATPARQAFVVYNDMFAAATDLGSDGRLMSGNNQSATKEAGEPNHAGNRGGKSIWFKWHAPSTPVAVTIDTSGSNFDTLLGVYTGTAVNALTTVASNDNYNGSTYSRVSFTATPGTVYRIAVDGRNGRSGNVTLGLSLAGAADTTPPDTTVTSGPPSSTTSTSASFAFSSTESGSTFQCRLDGAAFTACTSPHSYSGLAAGSHTFDVRAVDPSGNVDPTPASQTWTITTTTTSGPDTTITSGPSGSVSTTSASFAFTSTPSGGTFQCRLDGAAFAACTSPTSYSGLAAGSHTFDVRAVDSSGTVDATPASRTWTIDLTAPDTTISSGPPASTTSTSASFSFSSTESGSTFQCRLDGAAFAACTSPQSYSGLAAGTHTFDVRAVDAAGNLDASPATQSWTITASTGTGPANDNFANGQVVSGTSGSVTGTNVGATKESGEPNHAGNAGGKSVWYVWTAPQGGATTIDTIGSGFDTIMGVYTGTSVSALTRVASDDDSGGNLTSKVSFTAVAGTTYRIAVDGYNGASGSVKLNWALATSTTPPNDMFASALLLTGVSGTVTGSSVGATKEAGEPSHAGNAGGHSVWYRWTAPTSGSWTFDTIGSDFDTIMGVYTGTSVSALTTIAADDDSGGNLKSKVTFSATAGVTYDIAVDGYSGAAGNVTLNWTAGASTAGAAGLGGKQPSKDRP